MNAVREISMIKQNHCHLKRSCSKKLSIISLNESDKCTYHLLYHEKSSVVPRSVFLCFISVFFFFHVRGPKRTLRMHCSLEGLIVPAPYSILPVLTFAARCLFAFYTTRELQAAKDGTICGRENRPVILPRDADFHVHSRIRLHALNLRRGTEGFTSPPKEGVLRIFSPLKIRRLRPGLNPRTWALKANFSLRIFPKM